MKCGKRTCPKGRNVIRVCRDATRKTKGNLEFNLAEAVKDKK